MPEGHISSFQGMQRFKEIVRKCQHNLIELWMQLQDFWDAQTSTSRRTLSNAVKGPLIKKTLEVIVSILDEFLKSPINGPQRQMRGERQLEYIMWILTLLCKNKLTP